MKETQIVVNISTEGEVEIEASGFSDSKCLAETADLEKALGRVSGRTKKNHATAPVLTGVKVGKA
jgi:uncharacterized Fe-S cluster-containing protein